MSKPTASTRSLLTKILSIAVMTLVMLIPLAMIKDRISERESTMDAGISEVESSWGGTQTVSGPRIAYSEDDNTAEHNMVERSLYPALVKYDSDISSQTLHRSIYDVTVYTAGFHITGSFRMGEETREVTDFRVVLDLSDLRGIQGGASLKIGGREYEFRAEGRSSIAADVINEWNESGEETVPYEIDLTVRGSELLMFKPVGGITEASMTSDCTTPSFTGDFLPAERDVRDDGFTAGWIVSQINRGDPESSTFGVRLIQPVTQYQQSSRSAKYAILIILLVFLAGLFVEFMTGREINVVQYIVIGLSLVLFYSLLLAFSEFMAFGWSYLIATVMTAGALAAYFRAILKDRSAWMLSALVALAYAVSYVLLQMETFAFLTGTLILFALLCVIMYYTRNLSDSASD